MCSLEVGAGSCVEGGRFCSLCIALCTLRWMPDTLKAPVSARSTLLLLPSRLSLPRWLPFKNVAGKIKSIITVKITVKLKGIRIGHLCSRFFSCLCIDLPITVLFSQLEMLTCAALISGFLPRFLEWFVVIWNLHFCHFFLRGRVALMGNVLLFIDCLGVLSPVVP